jgi:hypothetical protein
MKATAGKKLIMGICVASVAALGAVCGGCGEYNCSISEMKSCSTSEDCVLVSCACCSYEAVNKFFPSASIPCFFCLSPPGSTWFR